MTERAKSREAGMTWSGKGVEGREVRAMYRGVRRGRKGGGQNHGNTSMLSNDR